MGMIEKKASVTAISGKKITVSISMEAACENCALAGACISENCGSRKIEVIHPNPESFKIGESVYIEMAEKEAFKAVFLSYIMPLILVIFTLAVSMVITNDEIKSGIFSIIILIPYYLLLLLSTKKGKASVQFKLRKASVRENG